MEKEVDADTIDRVYEKIETLHRNAMERIATLEGVVVDNIERIQELERASSTMPPDEDKEQGLHIVKAEIYTPEVFNRIMSEQSADTSQEQHIKKESGKTKYKKSIDSEGIDLEYVRTCDQFKKSQQSVLDFCMTCTFIGTLNCNIKNRVSLEEEW